MKPSILGVLLTGTLLLAGCSDQATDVGKSSSYPALQESDVRGLTPEQILGLRSGDAMGYGVGAELNGYPGPNHVLELARQLDLNASQQTRTSKIRSAALEEAKSTAEELIAAYDALDEEFRSKAIDEEQLRSLIGRLEGQLRAVHMSAHLEMMTVLTHAHITEYSEIRGLRRNRSHVARALMTCMTRRTSNACLTETACLRR